MRRILFIVVPIILVLAVAAGVLFFFTDVFTPNKAVSGAVIDKDTGKKSPYILEILKYDEINNAFVKSWIDGVKNEETPEDEFYSVQHNGLSEPLEFYLYIPSARESMGDITVANAKVSKYGNGIKLEIDAKKSLPKTKASTDLILHIYGVKGYAQRGEKP